ncbi:m7GpppX diphosphatase-like [Wyeomyia smithii]|uniref:m7GpppX diphosphatase-like n=1 Tax=Wyeomyia smithii TaxID=174621 RepID=UPI002467F965|nr:m7GpppX diphosphatase-like [Wyeomyia smithii]
MPSTARKGKQMVARGVERRVSMVKDGVNNPTSRSYDLADLVPVRILNNNSTHKSVSLLGHFVSLSRDDYAIVVLEKTAFTERHIVRQQRYLVGETAQDYQTVTLPHIQKDQLSLEWLYNILEHWKEKDRIVFEDPSEEIGFILLPDLEWDGKTLEQLYLLALVRQRGIKSLRDLNATHLPLMKNIQTRGIEAIKTRYGINADQLRIYIHYQPTFYHLHVHFTYLKHDPPGIYCEKSHLLTSVIGNVELLPDHYRKVTLSCVLSETDKLNVKFEAAKSELNEPDDTTTNR